MAHLLTGRIDLAEGATLEAINAWKPDIESDEVLLRYGVAAALRKRERLDACGLSKDNGTHSFLPAELRTVEESMLFTVPDRSLFAVFCAPALR